MTIKVRFINESKWLPKDYRRMFLHIIKEVLSQEDEVLFQQYYDKNHVNKKPFTFWASLPKATFAKEDITLEEDQLTLYLSTIETKLAFVLYNGFKKSKQYSIGKNAILELDSVSVMKERPVQEDTILVNMLSPLVVRNHEKGRKDQYYIANEDGFFKQIKINVKNQLESHEEAPNIEVIKYKKVIVSSYGTNIPASLGILKLTGNIAVLEKLRVIGIGSKTAAGFGKFKVIG